MPVGAIAAVVAVLFAFLGTTVGQAFGRGVLAILWSAAIACALSVGFQPDRERRRLVTRSLALIPTLEGWLKDGETLEALIRGDPATTNQKYVNELETCRR